MSKIKNVDKLVKAIVPMPGGNNKVITGKTAKEVDTKVKKFINSSAFMKAYYGNKKGGKLKKGGKV